METEAKMGQTWWGIGRDHKVFNGNYVPDFAIFHNKLTNTIMSAEIWVVPFFGQGHLLPSIELCKHLASRNFKISLLLPSYLISSVPSSLCHYPSVQITEIPTSPIPPQPHSNPFHAFQIIHDLQAQALQTLLSTGPQNPNPPRPLCAIIDVMATWFYDVFEKFQVPTVTFFTSGACSTALEHAIWKYHLKDMEPAEKRFIQGLPEDMALTYLDLRRRPHDIPPPPPRPGMVGPLLGEQLRWLKEVSKTKALMINTCDDLERPFIDYIANQVEKPVWGVGPLLPEQYWKAAGSLIHDRVVRANRRSNVTEDEVIQWLDSKARGSVLYVSFGSLMGPTMEEYAQLAQALESSDQPFIWVLQPRSGKPGPPSFLLRKQFNSEGSKVEEEEEEEEGGGYYPDGLDCRVGKRGLIIKGWAPQLLILSHPSTGGFLSHCGWNSTVEAIGRGVPILAWPIRGDQYSNAKLVMDYFKVGYPICDDLSRILSKDDIAKGIEKLMSDKEMKERAENFSEKFQQGFPSTSLAALDAFHHYITEELT
ncbi:scopoletin glucosyltransferase-like [Senna tora]|uniref:Glycosyltransferase n=1 Tax=Senna tora TaxID=362788 RepID=A0A834WQ08_9FABA|nr:scopoletin glucosyltransferase-like [Senna tora]